MEGKGAGVQIMAAINGWGGAQDGLYLPALLELLVVAWLNICVSVWGQCGLAADMDLLPVNNRAMALFIGGKGKEPRKLSRP